MDCSYAAAPAPPSGRFAVVPTRNTGSAVNGGASSTGDASIGSAGSGTDVPTVATAAPVTIAVATSADSAIRAAVGGTTNARFVVRATLSGVARPAMGRATGGENGAATTTTPYDKILRLHQLRGRAPSSTGRATGGERSAPYRSPRRIV